MLIKNFRIARLTAEHISTESKLRERIVYLEDKLQKYGKSLKQTRSASDNENDYEYDNQKTVEWEHQKLLP